MPMKNTLIKNATVVNEGVVHEADVRLKGQRIDLIAQEIKAHTTDEVIDATGLHLMPGMIDDQVHFREPGMPDKGTIFTESRAAVAGGITSYMEMPNVVPPTTNAEALQYKFQIAHQHSLANYSFYLGATNNNLEDIKKINPEEVCGVKIFMGASTGNLLVDDIQALENIFRYSPVLIATHCEDNRRIQSNLRDFESIVPRESWKPAHHPMIRDSLACYLSSSLAVDLAKKSDANLHVLHISTAAELDLFNAGPIESKRITAEACVHHLWFNEQDYSEWGNQIKCNPAIKSEADRQALIRAVNNDVIDIIATDHAPHTHAEKQSEYHQAPAGLPLVQHALLTLLDQAKDGVFSLEKVVEKVCHNPAKRYAIQERGFIREGYYADLVLADLNAGQNITEKLHYLCQWSPFRRYPFSARISKTFVNGDIVYNGDKPSGDDVFPHDTSPAMPLYFQRKNR